MTSKPNIKPHVFVADTRGHADYYGRFTCLWCPLPKANRIHDLTADQDVDLDASKLGEEHD